MLGISLFLFNCKSQQPVIQKKPIVSEVSYCLLKNLPFTIDYRNQIEKYTSIYNDTTIHIESSTYQSKNYKTVLELKASARYLWLLRMNEVEIDTFLVHCIAPTKSLDVELDPDSCEIEMEEVEYDGKGETIRMITRTLSIENWLSRED